MSSKVFIHSNNKHGSNSTCGGGTFVIAEFARLIQLTLFNFEIGDWIEQRDRIWHRQGALRQI